MFVIGSIIFLAVLLLSDKYQISTAAEAQHFDKPYNMVFSSKKRKFGYLIDKPFA